MFYLVKNWLDLFRRGKLLADSAHFYRQLAFGVALTTAVFIVTALLTGAIWVAALVSGFIGGSIQPYFFKNLRYR